MANSQALVLILLSLTQLFFLLTNAQTPSAPAPGPAGPINITAILATGGQFTTFIRLLNQTQVSNQITNQLNSSTEGMTVLAPTDNAFLNLPAGTLNGLSANQQVQLVLYHVLPKYYSLADLLTVSNPVRTQASGQDGGVFGLNFTGQANQVNVSSGSVTTQINNALRQQFPLAVYPVDKVLLPVEFSEAKPPAADSPPSGHTAPSDRSSSSGTPAADGPSPAGSGSSRAIMTRGLGVVGLWLFCMGVFA